MKYELTDESIVVYGRTLHRVKALKDIGTSVKKGDLGGFIEGESNLSQEGDCWVYGNAKIFDYARVWDSAIVFGSAEVCGRAEIYGAAKVWGNAVVFGEAKIFDSAVVYGNAEVCGCAWVYDSAEVCDNAKIFDSAVVCCNAKIFNSAEVCGNAEVCGRAEVCGNAEIYGNAEVTKIIDVFSVTPIGSRNDTTTFYKAKGGKIFVKCGCKNTDIDTWLGMVQATHGDNKHAKAYRLAAQIARLQILGEDE